MPKRKTKAPGLTLLKKSSTRVASHPGRASMETFRNPRPGRNYWIELACPEFTSICPITGQPDFGHITLRYIPDQLCLESKSLKLYLFAFRNFGAFHEDVINRILDDFLRAVRPRKASIHGAFHARGGIAIHVQAEYPDPA